MAAVPERHLRDRFFMPLGLRPLRSQTLKPFWADYRIVMKTGRHSLRDNIGRLLLPQGKLVGKKQEMSLGTVMVLHALARGSEYGFDIMEETGLTSGTIYPALDRLASLGLAASQWEDPEVAHEEKRPPRRYFRITPVGQQALAVALERYRSLAPVNLPAAVQPKTT